MLSPTSARAEVFRILQSAGLNTASSIFTDILTTFLEQIPQQYLSQAGIDQALGAALRNNSSLASSGSYDAAGIVIGVWIDVLGTELSKTYPPVAVEEIKYGLNLSANFVLAEAKYPEDPQLALLLADTQTTVGELFSTGVAFIKLSDQTSSNIAQSNQMDTLAAQYRSEAAQTTDQSKKTLLLQAAGQEAQAAAYLRANASGYSLSSIGGFLGSVWSSLFGG